MGQQRQVETSSRIINCLSESRLDFLDAQTRQLSQGLEGVVYFLFDIVGQFLVDDMPITLLFNALPIKSSQRSYLATPSISQGSLKVNDRATESKR